MGVGGQPACLLTRVSGSLVSLSIFKTLPLTQNINIWQWWHWASLMWGGENKKEERKRVTRKIQGAANGVVKLCTGRRNIDGYMTRQVQHGQSSQRIREGERER